MSWMCVTGDGYYVGLGSDECLGKLMLLAVSRDYLIQLGYGEDEVEVWLGLGWRVSPRQLRDLADLVEEDERVGVVQFREVVSRHATVHHENEGDAA